MKKSYDAINHLRLNLLYKDNMEQMYKDFIEIIESTKPTLSDKTNELIEVIKQKGSITKKELFNEHCGWGRGIKFTPYRRGLLEHPNIFDVMDKMPTYNWK